MTPPNDNAEALRRSVAAWRIEHKKQSYGGLWAFSGLSFQTGVFLLNFFRNLTRSRPLPSIEELSDIVCPTDNRIHVVVQVKRTLSRQTLAKALKEFAMIIRLIQDRNEATLLDSVQFQVVCGKRKYNAVWPWPLEAPLADDIRGVLGDIEARQSHPFILEQADPLV